MGAESPIGALIQFVLTVPHNISSSANFSWSGLLYQFTYLVTDKAGKEVPSAIIKITFFTGLTLDISTALTLKVIKASNNIIGFFINRLFYYSQNYKKCNFSYNIVYKFSF